ncbi:hypothetical protein CLU97_0689 [Chryseobacterium sp. 7]|uniref:hypothetical protein n=1 Tax=Chryseobacterium sp. 7 TaxID=2035214 RepID=UPI000EAD555E|nr:hypothetical protein [Chryseobacterium sp. 7]RLJ31276.1 hypothetical protein CLU97_0689 [Chryseobacterium sp. 7]
MRTSARIRYAYVSNILITIVSAVFGYNFYQAIAHPEKLQSALFWQYLLPLWLENMATRP